MYTIQPNYGGMIAAHVGEISAAQDEESRQEAEAMRLEKEYRSEIIREWAEVSIADGEENYDINTQAIWESWIDDFLSWNNEESLPLDIPMPTWGECVAALAIN